MNYEKLDAIPNYGDYMTLIEFIWCCQIGGFTNDDRNGMINNPSNVVFGNNFHM